MSPEARGRRAPRAGGDLNTRGEGRLRGALGGENKGGQRNASGRKDSQTQRGPPEQMRKPAGTQPGGRGAPPTLAARTLSPPQGSCFPTGGGGRLSPAGGALAAAFVQRPRAGEGAEASTAEQRAPESARRAPAPPSGRPLPSPSGALFVPAPGPGPEGAAGPGGEVAGAGAARGTYVSLWSSARRSLGTLRRWDSRLRRPSTVSSGGTDSS